ncbi:hypothetical protein K6W16_06540 [Burkholderia dolosa]|uniref:Uncharacterized protein n=1 Tax=Burkholderia dolosa TaxID=152500 RepID=A0A892IH66_9BURK|nr:MULTISPECIES: hypothetical protein [Burkholderia]MBR8417993.1 hypothetical protein [Burkholderia dolosa]MBY4658980.1 hypothetical protein [Burkholderia dolosa]MBY4689553.1 hypothetical protein [Burkholderia dolosa]MBY4782721.1 hypothetical protein [Burkholderia dolosa]MBY4789085.1 hypothetical protein [Burkholderia dolosa]
MTVQSTHDIGTELAHAVALAAALFIAALSHPRGARLLDDFEKRLIDTPIWNLGASSTSPLIVARYRHELRSIFRRARTGAGFKHD